jgi:hypothetical protein
MRLSEPFIKMMTADVSALAALCDSADCDWDAWDFRQKKFPPHRSTRTVPFLFLQNSIHPSEQNLIEGFQQTPLLQSAVGSCIAPLMELFGANSYPVKLMLAKVLAHGVIPKHVDSGVTLELVHRCHLPIITNEDVEFEIDGAVNYFAAGQWIEIDNQRTHSVRNNSEVDRVHLICDVYVKNAF